MLGLALGAAIAGSSKNRGYDNGYYGDGYYNNGYYNGGSYYRGGSRDYGDGYYGRGYSYARPYAYGYGYAPRTCVSRDRVYDPYIGRRVTIERRYAC